MRDAGKLHVIEAVLVGTMFFAAAGFVLTFDKPTTPGEATSDQLKQRGDSALATFYDQPLDDAKYGNNTMSRELAQAMTGNSSGLTSQLNATLPPDVLYNMYLDNGYGIMPVYEEFEPDGPTSSVSRLIEPKWSYVFTASNLKYLPSDVATTPTKMGLYTLPVSTGTSIKAGGADVDVIVRGNITDEERNAFRHVQGVTVRQAGVGDSIPHASLYFNGSADDPVGYRDLPAEVSDPEGTVLWYNLTLEETAGEVVPEGTEITLTFPRAWDANVTDDSAYSVVEERKGNDTRSSAVVELDRDVVDEALNIQFNATYAGDAYEFYTFQARVGEPVGGQAALLVRAHDQIGYTGGDFPHPRLSAPTSMGTADSGTWVLSMPNPQRRLIDDNQMDVDEIRLEAPGGEDLFADVRTVRTPDQSCADSWTVESPSVLVWDTGDCLVDVDDAFQIAFEVDSGSDYATSLDIEDPFHPTARYDNGYDTQVDRPFTDGLSRQFVAPDTEDVAELTGYPGWNHNVGEHAVDTNSVYEHTLLKGEESYQAEGIDTFQTSLALGSVDADKRLVPVGGSVEITTELESLLFWMAEQGLEVDVLTHIYPPWSLGDRDPIKTIDHVEKSVRSQDMKWLAADDVSGDGNPDVLAFTSETKVYAFDGTDGDKLSGFQLHLDDITATHVEAFELNSTHTAFAIGTEDGAVWLLDEDFEWVWKNDGAADVAIEDMSAAYDWDGDGEQDLVAGGEGHVYLLDGATGDSEPLSRTVGGPTEVEAGDLVDPSPSDDGETVGLLGTEAALDAYGYELSQDEIAKDQNGDDLEDILDEDPLELLKDPTIYLKDASIKAWDTQKDQVWEGGSNGFRHLATGDLDDNDVDDVVAANGQWFDSEDPGQVRAMNGTTNTELIRVWQIIAGKDIVAMDAPDHRHVNTVSDDGILMFTKDAWTTRQYYREGDTSLFLNFEWARDMHYPTPDIGWIVGDDNHMAYTTDGNKHVQDKSYTLLDSSGDPIDLSEATHDYHAIQWLDETATNGVVAGGDCLLADDGCLYPLAAYTTDGGDTWQKADLPNQGWLELHGWKLQDVHFPDAQNGFAVGDDGHALTTTDGGETWNYLDIEVDGEDVEKNLRAIHAWNTTDAVIVGDDGLILRGDADTWEMKETRSPFEAGDGYGQPLYDVDFDGAGKGYAVGEDGGLFVSENEGRSWVALRPPGPKDTVTGLQWHTVTLPAPDTGYLGGTGSSEESRFIGHLPTHETSSVAESEILTSINDWHDTNGDGLAEVRKATVQPWAHNYDDTSITHYLSNDGCQTWKEVPKKDPDETDWRGSVEYEMVEFDDSSGTDLCFRAELEAQDRGGAYYHSPYLTEQTIVYEYRESGSSTWETRSETFDLTSASVRNETATSARWNLSEGAVGNPLVQKFWNQRLDGEVEHLLTNDADGDGDDDVMAATGEKAGGPGDDDRVYLLDGTTGVVLHEASQLPDTPESMYTVSLPDLSGDAVPDVVVSYMNETDVPKVRALNGTNLETLWTVTANATALSYADGDLDGDGELELAWGTKALSATEQPRATSHQVDQASPEWEWTNRPDFLGTYSFTYDVPLHHLFGPYVVETSVEWELDNDIGTQSARYYDYFSVTTPEGDLPESPVYRIELLSIYEDMR